MQYRVVAFLFLETLPSGTLSQIIFHQLGKSRSSVGRIFRTLFRRRLRERFSKIYNGVEEEDEPEYWLPLTYHIPSNIQIGHQRIISFLKRFKVIRFIEGSFNFVAETLKRGYDVVDILAVDFNSHLNQVSFKIGGNKSA